MTNHTVVVTSSNTQSLYAYNASLPLACVGAILFSASALFHFFQYIKHRAWYMYLMMFGIMLEVASYWTRVIATKDPLRRGVGSASFVTSTLAPSFLAAGCYMTFGRMVYWVTPESKRTFRYIWAPARYVTLIFTFLDAFSFFIQCLGVLYLIVTFSKHNLTILQQETALRITYGVLQFGFVMQTSVFGLFAIIAFRFMIATNSWMNDWPDTGRWRRLGWGVVVASLLVTLRSVYRCLEFSLHRGNNYFRSHEWTFYMLDALPILIVLVLVSVVHPGKHLPQDYTTVSHAYKRPGFRTPAVKVVDDVQPASGYSRVSLVPPPLQPTGPPMGQMENPRYFTDPWANRPSPGAERF